MISCKIQEHIKKSSLVKDASSGVRCSERKLVCEAKVSGNAQKPVSQFMTKKQVKKQKLLDKQDDGASVRKKTKMKLADTESNRYGYIEVVEDALDGVETRSIGLYEFGMHLLQNYHEVSRRE